MCHCRFQKLNSFFTQFTMWKSNLTLSIFVFFIRHLGTQPTHTHFMVFLFFIIMTCYFPRIVSPLVPHSHLPMMCWDDQCDPRGCSFNHCLTLYTIFWNAALLLCHHHMPLSVGSEFHCRKLVLPTKSKHTIDFFVAPGFQCCFHCTSTYTMNSIWLTDSCIGIACYPFYKCCLLPKK